MKRLPILCALAALVAAAGLFCAGPAGMAVPRGRRRA